MINRKKFTKKINKYVDGIKDHEINMFRDFIQVNEISEEYLSKKQKGMKDHVLSIMSENKELSEKYYVFHLSKTIDTKWKPIDLDKIVNHFYKSSETIKKIYEEVR